MITNFKLFEGTQDWQIWDIKAYIDTKYPAKGGIGISVSNETNLNVNLNYMMGHYYSKDIRDYKEKTKETYQDIKDYLIKMGFKLKEEQYGGGTITYVWDLPGTIQKFNI
jgi:hypothetical protein